MAQVLESPLIPHISFIAPSDLQIVPFADGPKFPGLNACGFAGNWLVNKPYPPGGASIENDHSCFAHSADSRSKPHNR